MNVILTILGTIMVVLVLSIGFIALAYGMVSGLLCLYQIFKAWREGP